MATATATKAQPNQYGVSWVTSRTGKLDIALHPPGDGVTRADNGWEVTALYAGTHDLAPVTRRFVGEPEARRYANELWRTR
jgi:hypothetical protein